METPADRASLPPLFGPDEVAAPPPLLDTVRLRGPAEPLTLGSWGERRISGDGEVASAKTRLPSGVTLFLHAQREPDEASFEFSVPRLLRGHNGQGVDVAATLGAIDRLYTEAQPYLQWGTDVEGLRVQRLDMPRDFAGVEGIPGLLRRFQYVPVPRSTYSAVYANRTLGGVQNLEKGSKGRWVLRAYDKREQQLAVRTGGPLVEPGTLRVEVELRTPILRREGILSVSDMDEALLGLLAERYFHRSGLGTAIGGSTSMERVWRTLSNQGRGKDAAALLGILHSEVEGWPPPYGRNTMAKHRRLAKELGLTAADAYEPHEEPIRLDYRRGVVVRGEAAL